MRILLLPLAIAGAVQFPATHKAPAAGKSLDKLGFSRDDPDGHGHLTEISEGDLDLAEWFMLNAPRPAFAGTEHEYRIGVWVLNELGCASCHVSSWKIEAKSTSKYLPFAGDRRLFDLDVKWNSHAGRLEGKLQKLYQKAGDRYYRNHAAFTVEGMFTDLRHHDMGVGFEETDCGGNKNRIWRTAPRWGVGSGFPWGHDGQSLAIEHAILRHGGEAKLSRDKWSKAPQFVKDWMLLWFMKLQLYDIESLPSDIDGDGKIDGSFTVAGMTTQLERFNAEWLFRTPVRIHGRFKNTDGEFAHSFAATNLSDAYGLGLILRRDSDGWPDAWDHAPFSKGYEDGVKN